jgi:hypothetical protein
MTNEGKTRTKRAKIDGQRYTFNQRWNELLLIQYDISSPTRSWEGRQLTRIDPAMEGTKKSADTYPLLFLKRVAKFTAT